MLASLPGRSRVLHTILRFRTARCLHETPWADRTFCGGLCRDPGSTRGIPSLGPPAPQLPASGFSSALVQGLGLLTNSKHTVHRPRINASKTHCRSLSGDPVGLGSASPRAASCGRPSPNRWFLLQGVHLRTCQQVRCLAAGCRRRGTLASEGNAMGRRASRLGLVCRYRRPRGMLGETCSCPPH